MAECCFRTQAEGRNRLGPEKMGDRGRFALTNLREILDVSIAPESEKSLDVRLKHLIFQGIQWRRASVDDEETALG